MNKFLHTTLYAALTVLGVSLCSPAYSSDVADHNAILDVFEAKYGKRPHIGIIVTTHPDQLNPKIDRLGVITFGVNDTNHRSLCNMFNNVADVNYVIITYSDGNYTYKACN